MRYLGQVKNGVVVFDSHPSPKDGAFVRVEEIDTAEVASETARRLLSLAGKARGLPKDLARNHDHYLHGQSPK